MSRRVNVLNHAVQHQAVQVRLVAGVVRVAGVARLVRVVRTEIVRIVDL